MFISYFDDKRISEKTLTVNLKKLKDYRAAIVESFKNNNTEVPEASLFHCREFALHETLESIKKQFKGVKLVILVGIGGSSLGVEAIHSVLDQGQVKLSVLDTISAHKQNSAR
jgi:glucose-6-phosphate isomerase